MSRFHNQGALEPLLLQQPQKDQMKLSMNIFTRKFPRIPLLVATASLLLLGTACKDEEEILPVKEIAEEVPEVITSKGNQYVNDWIYDKMSYWYLWNDGLPQNTDKNQDPEAYFDALLDEEDRFSWIQPDYAELLNSLQGISKEAGYEFVLYREKEGSDHVILQVVYTKPGSPAANTGIKRGDIVSHINGQQITTGNYKDLLSDIKADHTLQYKPMLLEGQTFGEPKTIALTTIQYSENPNYLHKVIEVGGRKIGYFVYNFFASGTESQPGKYDAETDAVFAGFKAQGITDLVVDLRFNSGGSEAAARNLASLIGAGVDQTKIFLKRQYNDGVQEAIVNDRTLGPDFLVSHYAAKAGNVGNSLTDGRVYILTSSRTASASELIINALKPFMDVFLIGNTTYGKNVGSISLYEEDDTKNHWGLQPIVVKVYNSQDQSDYSTGFVPNILDEDNGLFLRPLGDPTEALLSHAVAEITGASESARQGRETRAVIGHSLDLKRRSFDLVMDESLLNKK
jgi:C-terminal processing protease CtpA/Prc